MVTPTRAQALPRLAHLALVDGLLKPEELVKTIALQSQSGGRLGDIFVQCGYMNASQVGYLRARLAAELGSHPAIPRKVQILGRQVLAQGMATASMVAAAHREWAIQRGEGRDATLAAILAELKLITAYQQVKLETQGSALLYCSRCSRAYQVEGFAPGYRICCLACRQPLGAPPEGLEVGDSEELFFDRERADELNRFGSLAILRGFATREQLLEAARAQVQRGADQHIGDVMLALGFLTPAGKESLDEEIGRGALEVEHRRRAKLQRMAFGEVALKRGFLNIPLLKRCLNSQLAARKRGATVMLGALMEDDRVLTRHQVFQVLTTQGKQIAVCPTCRAAYNVLVGGDRPVCPADQTPLADAPDDVPLEVVADLCPDPRTRPTGRVQRSLLEGGFAPAVPANGTPAAAPPAEPAPPGRHTPPAGSTSPPGRPTPPGGSTSPAPSAAAGSGSAPAAPKPHTRPVPAGAGSASPAAAAPEAAPAGTAPRSQTHRLRAGGTPAAPASAPAAPAPEAAPAGTAPRSQTHRVRAGGPPTAPADAPAAGASPGTAAVASAPKPHTRPIAAPAAAPPPAAPAAAATPAAPKAQTRPVPIGGPTPPGGGPTPPGVRAPLPASESPARPTAPPAAPRPSQPPLAAPPMGSTVVEPPDLGPTVIVAGAGTSRPPVATRTTPPAPRPAPAPAVPPRHFVLEDIEGTMSPVPARPDEPLSLPPASMPDESWIGDTEQALDDGLLEFDEEVTVKFACLQCDKRLRQQIRVMDGRGRCPRCRAPVLRPEPLDSHLLEIVCRCGTTVSGDEARCAKCRAPIYRRRQSESAAPSMPALEHMSVSQVGSGFDESDTHMHIGDESSLLRVIDLSLDVGSIGAAIATTTREQLAELYESLDAAESHAAPAAPAPSKHVPDPARLPLIPLPPVESSTIREQRAAVPAASPAPRGRTAATWAGIAILVVAAACAVAFLVGPLLERKPSAEPKAPTPRDRPAPETLTFDTLAPAQMVVIQGEVPWGPEFVVREPKQQAFAVRTPDGRTWWAVDATGEWSYHALQSRVEPSGKAAPMYVEIEGRLIRSTTIVPPPGLKVDWIVILSKRWYNLTAPPGADFLRRP